MGTRADFYVGERVDCDGRGDPTLVALGGLNWLGSVAYDGYPDNKDFAAVLAATLEADFRTLVAELLEARDDATRPEQGWPWPWKDSRTTDYVYAFFLGRVWICNFGRGWYLAVPVEHNCRMRAPLPVKFPDMTELARGPAGRVRRCAPGEIHSRGEKRTCTNKKTC